MTTLSHDPKGYYAVLGLAPGADLSAIKAAYRARVKAVHPDRNGTEGATLEFQRVSEAYAVLRDRVLKAEYDSTGSAGTAVDDDTVPTQPYACIGCGRVTAQPRYVVFHRVKSYLLWARRYRHEGIFCRDCADRAAVRASTATWGMGWWSIPGLILSPIALIRNLTGGTMPRPENARLLIRQARAFLARGEVDLARGLAQQALSFAANPIQRQQAEEVIAQVPPSPKRLKERWKEGGGVFVAQLLPLVALPVTVTVFALIALRPWEGPVGTSAAIPAPEARVGEIRHVAVAELKVREKAHDGSPVLALLDRFATVEVVAGAEDREWTKIRTPAGVSGFVRTRALYAGTGERLKREWCAENQGPKPEAGEALMRRASGDHRLLIHNDGRLDGVLKLKNLSGTTVTSFFVPATYHVGVGSLPEGTFRLEFAVGQGYSRACGLFVEDMKTGVLPFTITFKRLSSAKARAMTAIPEVSLAPAATDPNQPQPLSVERFLADE